MQTPYLRLARKYRVIGFGLIFALGLVSERVLATDFWEYAEEPTRQNNFAEARFRLWLPEKQEPIKGILFLALGTDSNGLHLVGNSTWQKLATELHFGLISCHFRGEGESYEMAQGGSGQALLNAQKFFSQETKRPELADLPLILWGHSAGGQFAYSFACWKPERTRGFVACKWAQYSKASPLSTYRVPALIIAGEHDHSGRNQSLAKVYFQGRLQSAPWAFLLEKDGGHGLDNMNQLALPFIASLAQQREAELFSAELQSGKVRAFLPEDSSRAEVSLFPNIKLAQKWQSLHQPCDLDVLMQPSSDSKLVTGFRNTPSTVDFGELKQDSDPSTLKQEVLLKKENEQDTLEVEFSDLALLTKTERISNGLRLHVSLDPRELPIGPYRSGFRVQRLSRSQVKEVQEWTVRGRIVADVMAQPVAFYLGVLPRRSQATFKLEIRAKTPGLELIKASSSQPSLIQPTLVHRSSDSLEFSCVVQTGERIGRVSGQLRFRVRTNREKEIVVPYLGYVQKN
jgi:predicted esterase